MKLTLLICVLCSWVVVARAGLLGWGNRPQADEPHSDEEDDGTDVLRMVEALTHDLQNMAGHEDGWLTRYQQVAEAMKENTEVSEELLAVTRMVVPIIWNNYMGNLMMKTMDQIKKGAVRSPYQPTTGSYEPLPPSSYFIYVSPTETTVDTPFHVQVTARTTAEANLGICIYYAPEEGEQLDFHHGDILFAAHIRWHFDYGNSREIAFNDRYNGVWSRPEMTVGGDQWPDFNVGEKFLMGIIKYGPCIEAYVILGRDMHMRTPMQQANFRFCPQDPKTGDPRKLWVAVNEDKKGAGEVFVHWITWFPLG